jgi:LPS sulfotransferase NodH
MNHRSSMSSPDDTVEFDFDRIEYCITLAEESDVQWGYYFARHELVPMNLFYEDLVAAYDLSIRKVLDFINVPHVDLPPAEPQLARMADTKSSQWERQFREMQAAFADSLRTPDV